MYSLSGDNMRKTACIIIGIFITSSLFAELSQSQKWAIALTGIMTEINHDSFNTLNSSDLNESNREKYKVMLSRDWGINTREELLSTIEKMENNGHAQELILCQKIINDNENNKNDFSIYKMINTYNLTSKQYNYLKFTLLNWSIFQNKSILVWDLGRNIALCRWGYDSGFLTEQEAWDKIMYFAKIIQPMYKSWEDYGFDYYMGRVFWASGFGSDVDYLYSTDPIYRKLISDSGYWKNLEWNIDLSK